MIQEAARPSRWPVAALALAVAALLAAWNPFAAPIGCLLGIISALVGWRLVATKRGNRFLVIGAFALGIGAILVSAGVLLVSIGALSTELSGQAVVPGRTPEEMQRLLGEAQQRTEEARGRAAAELEEVSPTKVGSGASRTRKDGQPSR